MLDPENPMSMPPVPLQDSVPIPVPPRRPLKRSASTASLPTPPRTHRKNARGRSRGSCDSDSDSDANEHAILTSEDENDHIEAGIHRKRGNKKRRTGEAEADNEEAFWLGSGTSDSAGLNTTSTGGASKTSKSHGVPLLYRRLLAQTEKEVEVAPVSPPPSHRKAAVAVSPASDPDLTDSPSPPYTPRTRAQTKKAAQALRDSPDNPFLVTPQKHIDSRSNSATTSPKTPPPLERPNLTYVFRGVRRVFNNPLYNHHEGRAYSPPPESKLPIDDPDYSPALNCPPRLLFPEARRSKGKKPARTSRNRRRSPSLSDDDGEEEHDLTAAIRPKLLDFGPSKAKPQTLDQELKSSGETLSI